MLTLIAILTMYALGIPYADIATRNLSGSRPVNRGSRVLLVLIWPLAAVAIYFVPVSTIDRVSKWLDRQ